MGDVFTAFLGGAQFGIAQVPVALLWNRDASKVLRIRRVFAFTASPQYREWITSLGALFDLMVYRDKFDAVGYFERVAIAHDQAAVPLGDVVCASGQGANNATPPVSSLGITGTGATVRRTWQSSYNPSWVTYHSYTHAALCNCPHYGEVYRASDSADIQKLTLRRGEALVVWERLAPATYRYPINVVIEFEQADA